MGQIEAMPTNNTYDLRPAARHSVLKGSRMVLIFDECHRSWFGENHKAIKDFFPKAQLFGY